jgi:hypothetical protein
MRYPQQQDIHLAYNIDPWWPLHGTRATSGPLDPKVRHTGKKMLWHSEQKW